MRWWILAFLAAVLLLASAGGFFWTQRPRAPPTWNPPAPRERCADADQPPPVLGLPAETTPVLLWGAGKVHLFFDGQPAANPPENPQRLAPGEHVLRAEAESGALQLTFRIAAFHPAMFHLEQTAGAGLTLVYLGAACISCLPPGKVALDYTRTGAADEALLEDAAASLRTGDWRAAASRLRGVQPKSRQGAAFHRLAANVFQSAAQPDLARAELEKVTGNDLGAVLRAWAQLSTRELAREGSPQLQRWNLVTQKFATLLEKFAPEAPGPVQLATSRLSELSAGFIEATQKKNSLAQDETVKAGEEALGQFIRTLRRSRPDDCEFQSRISSSL